MVALAAFSFLAQRRGRGGRFARVGDPLQVREEFLLYALVRSDHRVPSSQGGDLGGGERLGHFRKEPFGILRRHLVREYHVITIHEGLAPVEVSASPPVQPLILLGGYVDAIREQSGPDAFHPRAIQFVVVADGVAHDRGAKRIAHQGDKVIPCVVQWGHGVHVVLGGSWPRHPQDRLGHLEKH